jgi:hypothetical protein
VAWLYIFRFCILHFAFVTCQVLSFSRLPAPLTLHFPVLHFAFGICQVLSFSRLPAAMQEPRSGKMQNWKMEQQAAAGGRSQERRRWKGWNAKCKMQNAKPGNGEQAAARGGARWRHRTGQNQAENEVPITERLKSNLRRLIMADDRRRCVRRFGQLTIARSHHARVRSLGLARKRRPAQRSVAGGEPRRVMMPF